MVASPNSPVMSHRFAAALATIALSAASAAAQITNVQSTFTAGSVAPDPGVIASGPTGGAYYVGPYTGTIKLGATTIPVVFNCVDFFHDVSIGETWTSSLVNLGDGAGVGTTDANSVTRLYGNINVGGSTFSALAVYRAAAYLISTYPNPASSNGPATIAIQDEIWEMTSLFYPQTQGEQSPSPLASLDPTPGVTDGNGTTRTDGYSFSAPKTIANLAADLMNYSNVAGFDYANYWVVTSTTPSSDLSASPQEFIIHQTITPEPGTLVLFGSGMFSVVGGGRFRRRRPKNAA